MLVQSARLVESGGQVQNGRQLTSALSVGPSRDGKPVADKHCDRIPGASSR